MFMLNRSDLENMGWHRIAAVKYMDLNLFVMTVLKKQLRTHLKYAAER